MRFKALLKRMKLNNFFITLALISVSVFPINTFANETEDKSIELSVEVGADLVSSYLWRGFNLGGLSIQPSVTVAWKGLYLSGWGNIGADNWTFQNLCPELDITIGYDNYGVQLDFTHLYYFGGEKYFIGLLDPNNLFGNSTVELHAGLNVGEWVEKVPLSIDWYTTILGYDPVLDANGKIEINHNGNAKRAYSTYIQVGYDFYLPLDIVLGLKVGFTPWKGMYSDYEEVWTDGNTVGFNNIQLRAEREFELNNLYINVWGEAMFNCYGVNKHNIINTIVEANSQKLNGCIGIGIYFGQDW